MNSKKYPDGSVRVICNMAIQLKGVVGVVLLPGIYILMEIIMP